MWIREKSILKNFLSIFVVFYLPVLFANELNQNMTISLITDEGKSFEIGKLNLISTENGYAYNLNLDTQILQEEFLSMRPFQCLDYSGQKVCHLQYPYEIKRNITDTDLTDLEYDLLFLHKTPEEYGINAWNGLYYQLQSTGDLISGELYEVDLNVLAVPPAEGITRPITDDMLHKADTGVHAFPRIVIQ